ncbi:hypothetical protein B0183_00715 [Glaesserella parasuis]|nr:hypothetical protein B0183_00715 [Glaesserella parasuis]
MLINQNSLHLKRFDIQEQVKPGSIVYTDFYRDYDKSDVTEFNHFRINHSTYFAEKQNPKRKGLSPIQYRNQSFE